MGERFWVSKVALRLLANENLAKKNNLKGLQRLINLYSVVISCSIVDAFHKYFVVKHNHSFSISSHATNAVNDFHRG